MSINGITGNQILSAHGYHLAQQIHQTPGDAHPPPATEHALGKRNLTMQRAVLVPWALHNGFENTVKKKLVNDCLATF